MSWLDGVYAIIQGHPLTAKCFVGCRSRRTNGGAGRARSRRARAGPPPAGHDSLPRGGRRLWSKEPGALRRPSELERRGHCFLPLCGRLQHLRRQRTRRETAVIDSDRVFSGAAETHGEPSRECGGAAMAADVSALQHDLASGAEAAYRAAEPREADGEREDRVVRGAGTLPCGHDPWKRPYARAQLDAPRTGGGAGVALGV
jgi:hypothetical protein